MAGDLLFIPARKALIDEERVGGVQRLHGDDPAVLAGVLHRGQHAADVGNIGLQDDRRGEVGVGDDLLPVFALKALEQLRGAVQVRKLLLKILLPDRPDMRVGFRLRAGPVEIALRVFVHQIAFQPGSVRVHQRFILRDVLLLDQGDLLIEPAAQIVMIKPGLVHIIVHGLLLGGGDRHGGQLVKQRRVLPQRAGDAVHREAVLADGRAARHDLRVAAHEALGVLSAVHLHQVGVAVQVVKVLQQRQVERLPDVLTFDALRQMRRQIDRKLLVADGVLQHGFAKRLEARELLLLLLIRAAGHRQLRTQL